MLLATVLNVIKVLILVEKQHLDIRAMCRVGQVMAELLPEGEGQGLVGWAAAWAWGY